MCLGATARICCDLVSWQRLPVLMMQHADFLFRVKRSPKGQPLSHSKELVGFWQIYVDYIIGDSSFEAKCLIPCQSMLKLSCQDQSNLYLYYIVN